MSMIGTQININEHDADAIQIAFIYVSALL